MVLSNRSQSKVLSDECELVSVCRSDRAALSAFIMKSTVNNHSAHYSPNDMSMSKRSSLGYADVSLGDLRLFRCNDTLHIRYDGIQNNEHSAITIFLQIRSYDW